MTTLDDVRPETNALAFMFKRAALDVDGVGGGEVSALMLFECECEEGG